MAQFFHSDDGLSLFYQIHNKEKGRPVLCLSGLTRNSDDFEFLLPHLENHCVITMDYRGRGRSDYTQNYRSYTVATEAKDALSLLNHLAIPKASIIGTSRGGLIAMGLAKTAPERLAAVVLNDIGPDIEAEGLARIFDYLGKNPPYKTYDEATQALLARVPGFDDVSESQWRRHAQHLWKLETDGLKNRYDPKLKDALLESASQGQPDLWPYFQCLNKISTGLIRGQNSDLLTMETVEKMRLAAPNLIFKNVPDRGHCPFLDEGNSLAVIYEVLNNATY